MNSIITSCNSVKSVPSKNVIKTKSKLKFFKNFVHLFHYLDEQCSVTAKDVFQKKPDVKSVQNKVTLIKQGANKRAASNYQQPNFRTLNNFTKKMKIDEPTASQINESSPSTKSSQSSEIVVIENSSTLKPNLGKHYCIICQKQYSSSQSLYQHKKSLSHNEEV